MDNVDWLGQSAADFFPLSIGGKFAGDPGYYDFYSFTCEQKNASEAGLALRRADMSPKIAAQAIYVNTAIQVPEPSSALLGLSSLLCMSGLARLRRAKLEH